MLTLWSRRIQDKDLRKPAILFSPHPDDETLGCGGTIIRKRRAGADLKIVFMTDGASSHRRFISERELRAIRAQEALSACSLLGVEKKDVIFLEFEDQQLSQFKTEAVQRVKTILLEEACEEIFIPYARDNTPDHEATNAIVVAAVRALRKKVDIYEYPIWFWHHWPWTSFPLYSRGGILKHIRASVLASLGLIKNFRCSVPIRDVLELKRVALSEHKSQMIRLLPNPQWPTLNDVSNGEFLQCFFQDTEVFHKHQLF
jgi:LmbE family N-acetylglucosaminyl deacetylase